MGGARAAQVLGSVIRAGSSYRSLMKVVAGLLEVPPVSIRASRSI